MPAHVIVTFTPQDREKLKAYSQAAGPTVAAHGGEFLSRGPLKVLAGSTDHQMHAVIQFPTREQAESWYASAEYQALLELRAEGMNALFTLVGD